MMVDMKPAGAGVWTHMESNINDGGTSLDRGYGNDDKASPNPIPITSSPTTDFDEDSSLQDSIATTEGENNDKLKEIQGCLSRTSDVTENTYQGKLRKNFTFLVKELSPVDIIPSMIRHRLVTTEDAIDGINKNDKQSLTRILADLLGRGEDGYRLFLKCLQESDYHEVLRTLEPGESRAEYGFCRGKMPEPGYSKIRKNLEELQSEIYPADILPWLFQQDVISEEDSGELRGICKTGCKEKCMIELLHKLLNRGPRSYNQFLLCLEVKGYRSLVKRLEPLSEAHEVDVEYPGGGYDFNYSPESRQNKEYVRNKEKTMLRFLGDEGNVLPAISNITKGCVKVTFRVLVLDKTKTSAEDLKKRLIEGIGSGNIGGDKVKKEGFFFQTISDDTDLDSEESKRVEIENNKSELRMKEKLLQEEQEQLNMILEVLKERKGSKEPTSLLTDKVESIPEPSSSSAAAALPESSMVSKTDKKQIIQKFISRKTWHEVGKELEKMKEFPVKVNIRDYDGLPKILTVTGEKTDIDQFLQSSNFNQEEMDLKVVEMKGMLLPHYYRFYPIDKVIITGQGEDQQTKIYLRGSSSETNSFIEKIKREGRDFKIYSCLPEDVIAEGNEITRKEEDNTYEGYVGMYEVEIEKLYERMKKFPVKFTLDNFYPYWKFCIVGQDQDVEEIFKHWVRKVDVVTIQIQMHIKDIKLLDDVCGTMVDFNKKVHVEIIKNPSTELIFVNITGDNTEIARVLDRIIRSSIHYKSVSDPSTLYIRKKDAPRKYDSTSDAPTDYWVHLPDYHSLRKTDKPRVSVSMSDPFTKYYSIWGQSKVRGRHLLADYNIMSEPSTSSDNSSDAPRNYYSTSDPSTEYYSTSEQVEDRGCWSE